MDTLTFNSPILLRHLTFSEARKMNISEIHLDKALAGLELTMDQFVDLCILLGCDYCESIKGIGPMTALKLIKQHGNIEKILENLDKKYNVPEGWAYAEARQLFKTPDVTPAESIDLKWEEPDEEGIVKFLVTEKGFNEDRVRSAVAKLRKHKSTATQGRLDSFFKVLPSTSTGVKRKAEDPKGKKGAASGAAAKKGKFFGKKK